MKTTRRNVLKSAAFSSLSLLSGNRSLPAVGQTKKLPVAAVVSVYHDNSHADVILGKILSGWRQDGGAGPNLELVSLYTDQVPSSDLSRGLAEKYGFRLARTIDEAVTLGQDRLPVAGVLSIGEHGSYPMSETGQHQYPRRRFFDEIVAAMQRCGSVVPLFNDKHLSWNWSDAKHMYDTAVRLDIPFMAGSSVPVAWRYPVLDLAVGAEIEDVVAIGYGGLEAYGFHALEGMQCLLERRRGGETGVAAVTAIKGDAIWKAEKEQKWNRQLLQAALATFNGSVENLEQRLHAESAAFYLIEYRDGLKATVAMLNGVAGEFAVAGRVRGQQQPFACWFRLEEDKPFGHFEHLLRGIDHMIQTREPAYPAERTLLTTGILDRAMNSLHQNGQRLLSPELAIAYKPSDWSFANRDEENFPTKAR